MESKVRLYHVAFCVLLIQRWAPTSPSTPNPCLSPSFFHFTPPACQTWQSGFLSKILSARLSYRPVQTSTCSTSTSTSAYWAACPSSPVCFFHSRARSLSLYLLFLSTFLFFYTVFPPTATLTSLFRHSAKRLWAGWQMASHPMACCRLLAFVVLNCVFHTFSFSLFFLTSPQTH